MSLRETEMTRWYWDQVGGTLIEEFLAVPKGPNQGRRLLDGLIILGQPKQRLPIGARPDITGADVIIIQTKNSRLGMYLMGQTLFSMELVRRLNPRSVRSVALCAQDDIILRPLLEAYSNCEVVVCPPSVCVSTKSPLLLCS